MSSFVTVGSFTKLSVALQMLKSFMHHIGVSHSQSYTFM
jgi:hypothetical protein